MGVFVSQWVSRCIGGFVCVSLRVCGKMRLREHESEREGKRLCVGERVIFSNWITLCTCASGWIHRSGEQAQFIVEAEFNAW